MFVYHGTDIISAELIKSNGIDLSFGDKSVDNAMGFYTTPNLEFATQRAQMTTMKKIKFHNNSNVKPVVLKIEIDLNADSTLNIKEFDGTSFDWREFIFYNRLGKRFLKKWEITSTNHNLDFKYDIVIDETADAGVNDIISKTRYRNDVFDFDEIINLIDKADKPNWDKQISFHSYAAVKACIKSMSIIHLSGE